MAAEQKEQKGDRISKAKPSWHHDHGSWARARDNGTTGQQKKKQKGMKRKD